MPGHMPAMTIPSSKRRRLQSSISMRVGKRGSEILLETPCRFHRRQAHADDAHRDDNSTHPCVRAGPRHDQIGRQIEQHVTNIEQRQTSRNLLRCHVELRRKIVALLQVHRLRKSNIGPDCRAHEVENPEGWQDAAIKLAARINPLSFADGGVCNTYE
jgi:hypothetical protein